MHTQMCVYVHVSLSPHPFHVNTLKEENYPTLLWVSGLHWWLSSKEFAGNAGAPGDTGLIPGLEDHLEKGMATQSSILAWKKTPGQRSLAGYSPWVHKELDMTEQLSTHLSSTGNYGKPGFKDFRNTC